MSKKLLIPTFTKLKASADKWFLVTFYRHLINLFQSIQGNTIQYEVKWKGYSDDENTSEPEFRLNCDDKIVNYVTDLIDCTNYIEKIPKSIEALDKLKANKKAILGE